MYSLTLSTVSAQKRIKFNMKIVFSENKTPSDSKNNKTVSLKEHILFSDLDSQLFHFSVEGMTTRHLST